MKLTGVELHPADSSNVVALSFKDPQRAGKYNVKNILGLDADTIIPRFYKGSGSSSFYSLSLEKRDIIVQVELNPDFGANESYSDLRDHLYKMIASSRTGLVQIRFMNGAEALAAVSGFVTKFEAPHFTNVPEVQLTVTCDDPVLRGLDHISVPVVGLDPAATVIEDDISTAPHGFQFELTVANARAFLTISDPTDDSWSFTITPSGGFLAGAKLYFSSEYNNKHLYMVKSGVTTHLADRLALGSVWPILFPGENHFALTDPTNVDWDEILYYPTYWGV